MNEKSIGKNPATGEEGWSSPQRAKVENSGTDKVRELADSVRHTASDVAGQARHVASDVAGQARHAAESRLSTGRDQAIDRLGGIANAVRKTGEHLREEGDGTFTEYFDQAARQVDNAAGYLRNRTLGQVAQDLESFARREPALFLGGAFVAGLLTGRFLKSSGTAQSVSPASPANAAAHGNGSSGARNGGMGARVTSLETR